MKLFVLIALASAAMSLPTNNVLTEPRSTGSVPNEARSANENIGCGYWWCITKRNPEKNIGCPYVWCIT